MWGVKMQVFNTAKELADIGKYITKVQINISNIRRKPVSYTHLTLPTKLEV